VIFLERYSILAVLIAGVSAMMILTLGQWRKSLLAFAIQYLAVFWLCSLSLSFAMAGIKLLAGVIAAILLAGSPVEGEETNDRFAQPGWIFRLLAALLIWVVVFSLEPRLATWVPGDSSIRLGGMLLIGMGLLQLGISSRPGRVMLGLLTTLAGFEIIYSAMEDSSLVVGLLAMITLGLAFSGAFLLSSKEMEEHS
jgi:hypothetical protein